jgi:hypothetical protein
VLLSISVSGIHTEENLKYVFVREMKPQFAVSAGMAAILHGVFWVDNAAGPVSEPGKEDDGEERITPEDN